MKYALFVCSMLSITFVNAAEKATFTFDVENKHCKPMSVSYVPCIEGCSENTRYNTTATIASNSKETITSSNRFIRIYAQRSTEFLPLSIKDRDSISINTQKKGRISVLQNNVPQTTIRLRDDSSSDSEGCIQS